MRKYTITLATIFLGLLGLLIVDIVQTPKTSNPVVQPSVSASASGPLGKYYSQTMDWSACGNGFECSEFVVPLDYENPQSDSVVHIKVNRLKASGKAIGSLILNPGGPGGSGLQYAEAAEWVTSDKLRENFNIVGFDPRGVGASDPVHCMTDKQTDTYVAADGSPDTPTEIANTVELAKVFAQGCKDMSAELYAHVDTVSAAKDVDILRALLGDKKLNWLGKSYGTFLGATYADLFPENVGRMLLDGAIDPMLGNEEMSRGQAEGFEDALLRFADDCNRHNDCPLAHSGERGVAQITEFLNELDQHPGKLDDGRDFTQAMGVVGVVGNLYSKTQGWPELRLALASAFDGDMTKLGESVDFYTDRNPDGSYASNANDVIAAVNCLDRTDVATADESAALAKEWSKQYPNFGAYLAWSNISCTYWEAKPTGAAHKIVANGSDKILVVGTTHDPATPYVWATGLADQLSNAALLTLDGDGHTAYYEGSDCIDEVVDTYFLTGEVKSGKTCTDGP